MTQRTLLHPQQLPLTLPLGQTHIRRPGRAACLPGCRCLSYADSVRPAAGQRVKVSLVGRFAPGPDKWGVAQLPQASACRRSRSWAAGGPDSLLFVVSTFSHIICSAHALHPCSCSAGLAVPPVLRFRAQLP